MFRDHETTYVVVSVCLVWVFTILLAVYEIGFKTSDSWSQTVVAMAYSVGAAVGLTLLTIGTTEVVMLLTKIRDKKVAKAALEEGRQQGLQEAQEKIDGFLEALKIWYDKLPDDIREKTPAPPINK